jgi:hypothetical protein
MPEQQISKSSAAAIEVGLPVSWNVGAGPLYWYRVESLCQSMECETTGVDNKSCPSMTIITTVAATNVEDLCRRLANPRSTAPLAAKVTSIKRYGRPVFREDIPEGQCNTLDDVEFCQIPECFNYCPEEPTPVPFLPTQSHRSIRRRTFLNSAQSVSSLADFEFGTYVESFSLATESGLGIATESGNPIQGVQKQVSPPTPGMFISGSAQVTCSFFAHQISGSVSVYGFAFHVSPTGSFESSGGVSISGVAQVVSFVPGGGIAISGSADYSLVAYGISSGAVTLSGASVNESPSFYYLSSGSVQVSGEIKTFFNNVGSFSVPFNASLAAFGFGFEYVQQTGESLLSVSEFSVDACGCIGIGPTISARHNLVESEAFVRFLDSSGLSYPSVSTLRYRSNDSSWSSVDHLEGRYGPWRVSQSFQCQGDSWRLSLGLEGDNKKTKLILDIPAEIVCSDGFIQASVVAYLSSYSSPDGQGVKIDAVSPRKKRRSKVEGSIEAFVNGIFVPQTIYYDELGIFKDAYWYGLPFEINMNPIVRDKATVMDVSWVT